MAVFGLINLAWNSFGWAFQAFFVYTLGGCLVSLALIARALRQGTLTTATLGLTRDGWRPQRWFVWLAFMAPLGWGSFMTVRSVAAAPSIGDFCFWFIFLLAASLAELLVFISIGFCLPEGWLRRRGLSAFWASVLAAAFSGVAFGLYHYTHEPRWHQFALFPLIPLMWIILAHFVLTRSFHLTLLLHNSVAAAGFTYVQYLTSASDKWMDPQTYLDQPEYMPLMFACFVIPYGALLVMQWRRRGAAGLPCENGGGLTRQRHTAGQAGSGTGAQ
jgi:hypothetical protein